jgi:DNA-binding CsgD family transcriptional regulator
LAAAGATATELGMNALAQRCRSELARPAGPSRRAEPAAPGLPDGLSGREVEVLRLVAAGCSNREIGERLFISQNTAANHIRSILRKTASANRAEAAAYAARHGLLVS